MTAQTAREALTAKVATRSLDQIVSDLRALDAMEYTVEIAIVYKTYTDRMAADFPELDEAAWTVLEAAEAEHVFPSYGEALQMALQMATEA